MATVTVMAMAGGSRRRRWRPKQAARARTLALSNSTHRKGGASDGSVEDGAAVVAGGAGQTPDRSKPIAVVVSSGGRERRESGSTT